MNKNKLLKLFFKLLIVLISYGYIYYKIQSSHIDWTVFNTLDIKYLFLAILLMPINWLLESFKWQSLLKDVEQISLTKAIQGVMVGITSGMATPNRVGEYVGRTVVLQKQNRVKGSLATMLGSLSQILITLILGMVGWLIFINQAHYSDNLYFRPVYMAGLGSLMVFLLLIFYNLDWIKRLAQWFSINQRYIDEIRFLTRYKSSELSFIIFLSFFRYLVFAAQYIVLLMAFGVDIPLLSVLSAIFIIYLIIVFIPHFSITELGVRSSVAVLVFQNFTSELHIVAVVAMILWLINLAIPTFVGSFLLLGRRRK